VGKNRTTLGRIAAIGGPLLVSQMSQYVMSVADTAMVGRLGAAALAAISIGATTSWLLFVFAWPVSVGVQAVAARRFGRNESGGADARIMPLSPVLGAGLIYTGLAASAALLLSLAARPAYGVVLKDPAVAEGAASYLDYVRWAVPLIGLGGCVQGFMNAMRRTRAVMAITVAANGLNVVLNWVFIFGRLGLPAMGLAGAGLATLVSQMVQAAALWLLVALDPALGDFRDETFRPDGPLVRLVARLSLPVAIQNGLALFIFLSFDAIVENIGAVYLAVTQIVFSFYRINKTIVGGFARGAGILAGNLLGAGSSGEARRILRVQQGLGLAIGLAVMSLVLALPGPLVRIFSSDPEIVALGVRALRFFAGFYLIEISAFSLEIVFQAVGWSRYVLFSEFSTNVVFILGATLLFTLAFGWGIWGAWLGFALYQLGHALILAFGWLSGRWYRAEVKD